MNWKQQVEDFRRDLKVEEPTIRSIDLRIGFFGSIGSGKTTTAAICALAITPAPGLIGIVDGEHGRSGLALDVAAGLAAAKYGGAKHDYVKRFRVVHIDPPFNPLRVIAAGQSLIESGCKTLILDIISQAWDSSGGYLDLKNDEVAAMVAANRNTTEQKVAQAAAAHVKPWTHTKLVHFVEECKGNVILCFQAKQKWDPKNNTVSPFETPIQESGITRTAIAVGLVESRIVDGHPVGGFTRFSGVPGSTKHTHPDLLRILPNGEQFTFAHGENLVKWLGSWQNPTATPAGATKQKPAPDSEEAKLRLELWELTKAHHNNSRKLLTQWLIDEVFISDTETFDSLTVPRLREVIAKVKTVRDAKP